jgi:hypothetical protein
MLDLVGPHRTVTLQGPPGDPGLTLNIDVEYHNIHPERGEAWVVIQARDAQDGHIDQSYTVVPVRIAVRSQDGRISRVWDNGELVTGERGRVALEHGQDGPLSGTLTYEGVPRTDPPCNALWVMFDFRQGETLARVTIENPNRYPCIEWNTSPRPVPWRVIVNPRDR